LEPFQVAVSAWPLRTNTWLVQNFAGIELEEKVSLRVAQVGVLSQGIHSGLTNDTSCDGLGYVIRAVGLLLFLLLLLLSVFWPASIILLCKLVIPLKLVRLRNPER
jgi:hypothetical protein